MHCPLQEIPKLTNTSLHFYVTFASFRLATVTFERFEDCWLLGCEAVYYIKKIVDLSEEKAASIFMVQDFHRNVSKFIPDYTESQVRKQWY
jgi:hypothetical protein